MRELRDVLRDPAVAAAADAVTSSMITGFGKTAKFVAEIVAGLRIISGYGGGNAAVDADDRVRALKEERDAILRGSIRLPGPEQQRRLAQLNKQLSVARQEYSLISNFQSFAVDAKAPNFKIISEDEAEAARKFADELDRIQKAHLNDKITSGTAAMFRGGIFGPRSQTTGDRAFTSTAKDSGLSALLTIDPKDLENARGEFTDTLSYLGDTADDIAKQMKQTFGDSFADMSEFAKEAARNTQDAFATFFFDPFHAGVKGLLRDLIDAFRHALADKAAQDLLKYFASFGKGGSNAGTGGIVGSILGGIFGGYKAAGGPVSAGRAYVVGERGPELFLPGASGAIAPSAAMPSIVINNNIDARGATTDLIQALPAVLRANNEQLKSDIMDTLTRRPPPTRR
jgi:hypothetical protein